MKSRFLFSLLLMAGMAVAEDARVLATLPAPAVESLRAEMRDNVLTINEILTLVSAGKVKEAGVKAEKDLGVSAMGKHRDKPMEARPGPHMPPEMHAIGMEGHKAASEFARIAATGNQKKAVAALPMLTGGCVGCHFSYRIR